MLSNMRMLIVKSSVVIALFATMGFTVLAQAPVAQAHPAPREPISCYTKALGSSGQWSLPGGYWSTSLYAAYSSYDNSYCGYMWAQTHVHLNPGAPWGSFYTELANCSGNYVTNSTTTYANGGGSIGYDYWSTSPQVYQACGEGIGHYSTGGAWYATFTGIHWA